MTQYNAATAGGSYSFVKKERRGRRSELPDDVAKKLKSCSVLGCEEWRDLTAHTTYHCFPTGDKNQQRWEIWTSLLQKARDDAAWIPFRGSLVCSHHFRNVDFVQDPNQKRTKLVKNAIPSIFPTFQVDLEDPNFILDDSNEYEGENEYYEDVNGYNPEMEMAEYSNQNSYEYEQPEQDINDDDHEMPVPEVLYDEEPDEDEPELQYVHKQASQAQIRRPPNLIPAKNLMQSIAHNSQDFYAANNEPPIKKSNMGTPSGIKMASKPPLTFKGTLPIDEGMSTASSSNLSRSKSKLYEQLCKSTASSSDGSSKIPFSWNPDLEIELLEPTEDSALKQRIEELENEKQLMKHKYENQIRALQRKIREQDRIINQYAVELNVKKQRA